jgi:hypothetical protein
VVADQFGLAQFRESQIESARSALIAEPALHELLFDIGLWDLAGAIP